MTPCISNIGRNCCRTVGRTGVNLRTATARSKGDDRAGDPRSRARSPTHKPHPDFDGGEFDERELVGAVFFKARRDGAEVLELVEVAFDEIAQPVEEWVEDRNVCASGHRLDVAPGALRGGRGELRICCETTEPLAGPCRKLAG